MSLQFPQAIDARTRYCAVYGHPVKHSASPAMQNAGLADLGLNWRYLAFEVWPEELRAAIEGARAMNFIGINLTVPHKLLALEMANFLDVSATTWGAVNTIVFEGQTEDGSWRSLREFDDPPARVRSHGYNTDADAIVRALSQDLGIQLAGAKVLLLGAGGAGRTAALRLAAEGVGELFLVNRTREKAQALAQEIRARYPRAAQTIGYPSTPVELILNATSLGLKPDDPMPLDESQFPVRRAAAVYDMIYRPAQTTLLKAAQSAGCRTANGLGMLLYQGARALELWTGQPAPVETMRAALEKEVYG